MASQTGLLVVRLGITLRTCSVRTIASPTGSMITGLSLSAAAAEDRTCPDPFTFFLTL
jgi:hypothetical protein